MLNSMRRALVARYQNIGTGEGILPPPCRSWERLVLAACVCLLAAAATLGAGLALLRQASYGPVLGWDGINYIMVARNLLAGDGFADLYHEPMVLWPPLYPAMLAGGGLFGIDSYSLAGPLNAVIFGLTVLIAGWWLRRELRSRLLWLWGCLSIALALPLVDMASQIMSETAFILFITLSLTQLDAHLKGGSRASLIWAAAFGALACLTRYLGASLILAALPMLLAARVALPEKMKRVAVYALIAAAPVCLWMLRNFLALGSTTGGRDRTFDSFSFIVDEVVDEALQIAVADSWLLGLTVPLLFALVIAACHAFIHRSDRKSDASSEIAWRPLRVFGGFALAYITLLVAAIISGDDTLHGLQWRYLTPVYIPLLLAALLLMDGVLRYAGIVLRRRGVPAIAGRTFAVVLMLALSMQLAWLVMLNGREIQAWNAGERQEYAAPLWSNSESAHYISEAALSGVTLNNALAFTSFYANGSARHYSLPCEPDSLRYILLDAVGSGEAHIIYYFDGWRRSGCSPQQDYEIGIALSREPLLEPVAELANGKVYRLREPEILREQELLPAMSRRFNTPVVGKLFDTFLNESGEPAVRADFDIYIDDDTLVYVREPCARADTKAMFFLHLIPDDVADLPDHLKRHGFDNLDFDFPGRGTVFDGKCIAAIALPEYDIAEIRTGQYVQVEGGFDNLWEVEFPFNVAE